MRFFNLILFSHLFIAFCASSLYLFYKVVLDEAIDLIQYVFIFFGTSFAYNLIELFPDNDLGVETLRGSFIEKNKRFIISLSLVFFFILSFLFFELDLEVIRIYIALFFMVVFYEGSFYKKFSIRKIPYLKAFYIAFVWALALFAPDPIGKYASAKTILTFIEAFLFILTLCLAFDIRDFKMDQDAELKTIVTRLGPLKSSYLCLIIFIIQAAFAIYLRQDLYTAIGEFISFFIFYYLLKKVSTEKGDLWCYAGIDGVILLKWLGPLLHMAIK